MRGLLRTFLAALALLAAASAQADTLYRWTQYVPGGLEARAVTREAQCPQARIDHSAASMRVRAERNAAFPVLVCALAALMLALAIRAAPISDTIPPYSRTTRPVS